MFVFWLKLGLFVFSVLIGLWVGNARKRDDFVSFSFFSWIAALLILIVAAVLWIISALPPAEYGFSYAVIPALGYFVATIIGVSSA